MPFLGVRTPSPRAASGVGTVVWAERGGSILLDVVTNAGREFVLSQAITCG